MTRDKAALHRGNDNSAKVCQSKHDQIITEEYKRGTWWAGLLLVAMFALLSFGSVVFGW